MPPTSETVREAVAALSAPDDDSVVYLNYHRRRYAYLMEYTAAAIQDLALPDGEAVRILDIGISHQTVLLRKLFPRAELSTFGFQDPRFQLSAGVSHVEYNLNHADDISSWPNMPPCDVIVMAEVIEHLYVPPTKVLRMLQAFLRPGGVLIIQTPNPICLSRRVALARGHSPFEIIRDDPTNPGHYCEYTTGQLRFLAKTTGFDVLDCTIRNYFGEMTAAKRIYIAACALLPGELAEGITIQLRKPLTAS